MSVRTTLSLSEQSTTTHLPEVKKQIHETAGTVFGGYVVALANERGGRLVLGMADARPHEVVGSDFAESIDDIPSLTKTCTSFEQKVFANVCMK